jgi:hypothetical protein
VPILPRSYLANSGPHTASSTYYTYLPQGPPRVRRILGLHIIRPLDFNLTRQIRSLAPGANQTKATRLKHLSSTEHYTVADTFLRDK